MVVNLTYYIHKVGIMVKVFTNGLGDQGSIPGWVIPKVQKMVLDTSLLNTQHYKVRIKDKWRSPRKGVALSPTSWYCSYWKESPRAVLYSHEQLYIHICMQKHIPHNKDERTQFFRKIYPSLYWKDCVWEVSWRLNRTATYWPPPQLFWL